MIARNSGETDGDLTADLRVGTLRKCRNFAFSKVFRSVGHELHSGHTHAISTATGRRAPIRCETKISEDRQAVKTTDYRGQTEKAQMTPTFSRTNFSDPVSMLRRLTFLRLHLLIGSPPKHAMSSISHIRRLPQLQRSFGEENPIVIIVGIISTVVIVVMIIIPRLTKMPSHHRTIPDAFWTQFPSSIHCDNPVWLRKAASLVGVSAESVVTVRGGWRGRIWRTKHGRLSGQRCYWGHRRVASIRCEALQAFWRGQGSVVV